MCNDVYYQQFWLDLQKLSLSEQEMKSNLLLIIKLYTLSLPINTKHIAIDGQVCFHWWLIANFVKPPWCTTGSVGLVNGINKDLTGAKLLSMTVSTCAVYWVPVCHFLKTQHCYLCPYGRFNPPLATHFPPSPTPSLSHPPTHLL